MGVAGGRLRVAGCRLQVVGCSMLDVRCSRFNVRRSTLNAKVGERARHGRCQLRPYVFSVVAAPAKERGLQSAGVLVSEGPVLRSSTAETERSLRSRLAAFCRSPSSHTAKGGGFEFLR